MRKRKEDSHELGDGGRAAAGGSATGGGNLGNSLDSILDIVSEATRQVPERDWARLPTDLSKKVDHYLYGSKKKEKRASMDGSKQRLEVCGVETDAQTRCVHYHSELDIVAIKMRCCGVYWACKDCHVVLAGHAIAVWPRAEWDARAVLCGACGVEMTIRHYLDCEARCPDCGAQFNPACRKHWHFYFEVGESERSV